LSKTGVIFGNSAHHDQEGVTLIMVSRLPIFVKKLPKITFDLNLVLGGFVMGMLSLLVLFGPSVFKLDPYAQDLYHILEPPDLGKPGAIGLFGTDSLGRDVFSRVVMGGIPLSSQLQQCF
jgi:ABC-type dipeptide/oligopeptide/nickel transport system permease subunit